MCKHFRQFVVIQNENRKTTVKAGLEVARGPGDEVPKSIGLEAQPQALYRIEVGE
jgi:hypothetical protein